MKKISAFDGYTRSSMVNIYDELDIVGMELLNTFMKAKTKLDPIIDLPCYNTTKFEYAEGDTKYLLHSSFIGYPDIYIGINPLPNNEVNYVFGVERL